MKITKDTIIYFILICVIGFLSYTIFKLQLKAEEELVMIEEIKNTNKENQASFVHYEQEIDNLSKLNKNLYDSLKIYKNQIDYLVQFKYEKKYDTGVIRTDTVKEIIHNKDSVIKTYEYVNTNDTLAYNLKIGSAEKPEWYSLDFKVSDQFTIVNKKFDNFNKTDIESNGIIDDVTILKKKEKKNLFDNISIGPSITMGYDIAKKEPEFIVGFSITYDLKDLIWKKK
jgi:hypothetical protein